MGGATGTLLGVANQIDIFPFIPRADLTIDRLSVNVTTLVAAAQGKIVVYDADASGLPNNLIVETATLDFATTGIKEATVALTFRAGVTYWIGMRTSSTATLSAWGPATTPELTANGITINPRKLLRRTLAFATAAPATWGYLVSEVTSSTTAFATAIWLDAVRLVKRGYCRGRGLSLRVQRDLSRRRAGDGAELGLRRGACREEAGVKGRLTRRA